MDREAPLPQHPPFGLLATLASAAAGATWIAVLDTGIGYLAGPESVWTRADFADAAGLTALAVFVGLSAALLGLRLVALLIRHDARAACAATLIAALGVHLGVTLTRVGVDWVSPRALLPALPLGLLAGGLGYFLLARSKPGRSAWTAVVAVAGAGLACELAFVGRAFDTPGPVLLGWIGATALATALAIAAGGLLAESSLARVAALALPVALGVHPVRQLLEQRDATRTAPPRAVDSATETARTFLIVVDTLRAGELSCYASPGATPNDTPAIDALATDGVLFETTRAPAGWTRPSVASILSGLSPWVHGSTAATLRVPAEAPLLAEVLAAAGWRTGAFGENALLLPYSGLARGFERYDIFPRYQANPPFGQLLMKAAWPERVLRGLVAPDLNTWALAWLDAQPAEPTFAWLHYLDVHQPYTPRAAFRPTGDPPPGQGWRFGDLDDVRRGYVAPNRDEQRWIRALYSAEIRQLDAEVGAFLDALRERGWYDDATIVFTSDHGEEFWEHGGYEHGHTLYDELLRVPLIVKLPLALERSAPQRVASPVTIESITPTLLTLAGIETTGLGFSAPALFTADGALAPDASPTVFVSDGNSRYPNRAAIVARGHKYIRWDELDADGALHEELYDLTADPAELDSLVKTQPMLLAEYRALFDAQLEVAARQASELGIESGTADSLDAATQEELRALGYVK